MNDKIVVNGSDIVVNGKQYTLFRVEEKTPWLLPDTFLKAELVDEQGNVIDTLVGVPNHHSYDYVDALKEALGVVNTGYTWTFTIPDCVVYLERRSAEHIEPSAHSVEELLEMG